MRRRRTRWRTRFSVWAARQDAHELRSAIHAQGFRVARSAIYCWRGGLTFPRPELCAAILEAANDRNEDGSRKFRGTLVARDFFSPRPDPWIRGGS